MFTRRTGRSCSTENAMCLASHFLLLSTFGAMRLNSGQWDVGRYDMPLVGCKNTLFCPCISYLLLHNKLP